MTEVEMTGKQSGITMRKIVFVELLPSMQAASSISIGTDLIKFSNRKIAIDKLNATYGKMSVMRLSSRPSDLNSVKMGMSRP